MHVFWISQGLASVCLETGRSSEAEALYARALEARERFPLQQHENQLVLTEIRRSADVHSLPAVVSDYMRLLENQGRVPEALRLCKRLIAILRTPLSEDEQARRETMRLPKRDLSRDEAELSAIEHYASLLRLAHRTIDAVEAEQQAASLHEVVRCGKSEPAQNTRPTPTEPDSATGAAVPHGPS